MTVVASCSFNYPDRSVIYIERRESIDSIFGSRNIMKIISTPENGPAPEVTADFTVMQSMIKSRAHLAAQPRR
jgi:hypothetical protein